MIDTAIIFAKSKLVFVLTTVVLAATTSWANELDLRGIGNSAFQSNQLTKYCSGSSKRFAQDTSDELLSWIEVIKYIKSCDIDSMVYFNDDQYLNYLADQLDQLAASSRSSSCVAQTRRSKQAIYIISREIKNLVPMVTSWCHMQDFKNDKIVAEKRLNDAFGSYCQRVAQVGIGRIKGC